MDGDRKRQLWQELRAINTGILGGSSIVQSFKECFDWAITELMQIGSAIEELEGKKSVIILELARRLEEKGMPKYLISTEISKNLKPYISNRYVQGCLEDEYKDKKKSTGRLAKSSPNDSKKVLLNITSDGSVESDDDSEMLKEEAINEIEASPLNNDRIITIRSPQNKIKVVGEESARLLSELLEENRQLKEIESKRIMQGDFISAASLPAKNELQRKIETLEKSVSEQDALLAETRFEADLELPDQSLPLIIVINRSTTRASVTVNHAKMKRY
jgi:hypothetical protein